MRDNGVWPPLKSDSVICPATRYVQPTYPKIRVSVAKAFYVDGRLVEPGHELSLDEPLALDMIFVGRAVAVR
jgi:hypothetical protein